MFTFSAFFFDFHSVKSRKNLMIAGFRLEVFSHPEKRIRHTKSVHLILIERV